MARLPDLVQFAQLHGLKIGTIADLIAYRRRYDHFVERAVETDFPEPSTAATGSMIVYVNTLEYAEHIALVKGESPTPEPVLVRMHALNIFSRRAGLQAPVAGTACWRNPCASSPRRAAASSWCCARREPTFVSDVLLRRVPDDIDRRRRQGIRRRRADPARSRRRGHDPAHRHAGEEGRGARRLRPQHRRAPIRSAAARSGHER